MLPILYSLLQCCRPSGAAVALLDYLGAHTKCVPDAAHGALRVRVTQVRMVHLRVKAEGMRLLARSERLLARSLRS